MIFTFSMGSLRGDQIPTPPPVADLFSSLDSAVPATSYTASIVVANEVTANLSSSLDSAVPATSYTAT